MSWQDHAACKGMDVDIFYPPRGDYRPVLTAKAICNGCPVRAECLDAVLEECSYADDYGIRGATTPDERRKVRKKKGRKKRHGKESTYSNGCRCPLCTGAHRRYRGERRLQGKGSAA